jgi:hypothetical protein
MPTAAVDEKTASGLPSPETSALVAPYGPLGPR